MKDLSKILNNFHHGSFGIRKNNLDFLNLSCQSKTTLYLRAYQSFIGCLIACTNHYLL